MSALPHDSGPTSNDLLSHLVKKHLPVPRQNTDLLSNPADEQHNQADRLGEESDGPLRP
jgi:hypothetical protein